MATSSILVPARLARSVQRAVRCHHGRSVFVRQSTDIHRGSGCLVSLYVFLPSSIDGTSLGLVFLRHYLQELKTMVAANPPAISGLTALYSSFIKEFEAKLNPVSLVYILIDIAATDYAEKPTEAIDFLSITNKPVIETDTEAHILMLSELAHLHLAAGDTDQASALLGTARSLVESSSELAAAIHSAFYRVASEYHKRMGTAAEFYRNALQLLAYTPVDSLPPDEQLQLAFDVAIAAVVGEDIYNFGEVLSHAVVTALAGTEHAWLHQLLVAFQAGDLGAFDSVCASAASVMNTQPALVAGADFIRQKVTLCALMTLATGGGQGGGGVLSFSAIAESCRLPVEEVDFLVMRALSLGLVSGVMDGVDQKLTVTRVQPRVVGREAVGGMAQRLDAWCGSLDGTVKFLEGESVGLVN